MAKKTIKAQMKQRRDTKANWAATNPVLLDGELGIVSDDPNLYKVGDGATAWNDLPFRGFDGTLAQELGTSPNAVISQKVVSEKLTELESKEGETSSQILINKISTEGRFVDCFVDYNVGDTLEILSDSSNIIAILADNAEYQNEVRLYLKAGELYSYAINKPIKYIRFFNNGVLGKFDVEYKLKYNIKLITSEVQDLRSFTNSELLKSKLYDGILERVTFADEERGYDLFFTPNVGDVIFWRYKSEDGLLLSAYVTNEDGSILVGERENGYYIFESEGFYKFNFFLPTLLSDTATFDIEVFVKTKADLLSEFATKGVHFESTIVSNSKVANMYCPIFVKKGDKLFWETKSTNGNNWVFIHKTEEDYIQIDNGQNRGLFVVDSDEYQYINIFNSNKQNNTIEVDIFVENKPTKEFSISDINENTFIGGMNKVITALLGAKPTALFCFVGYYSKSESIDNRLGRKIYGKDILDIQTILADYWDAKLIRMDEFGISWRNNTNTALAWMTDGIHVANYKDWDVVDGKPQYTLVNLMARRLATELKPFFADWSDKKILWLGTSIPAGSHHESDRNAQYPLMVANILGCSCDNKSVPSSFVRLTRDDGSAIPNSDTLSLLSPNATTYYMRDIVEKANDYDLIIFDHGRNDGSWSINDFTSDFWDINS